MVEMTAHPWLSRAMFCSGFIVGFCLCSFTISHFRGIPSSQWPSCLATFCRAPAVDSDPALPATGASDSPSVPSGRLLCRVLANQKEPYSRGFLFCSGVIFLVSSTPDPNVTTALHNLEEREKLHHKTMAAFAWFHRRYNRFVRATDDARMGLEKLRWSLSQFLKRPVLFLGWGLRTCFGRGYMLSRHTALRLVEALRNHPSLEVIQVSCCPETLRVRTGEANGHGGPISFHFL